MLLARISLRRCGLLVVAFSYITTIPDGWYRGLPCLANGPASHGGIDRIGPIDPPEPPYGATTDPVLIYSADFQGTVGPEWSSGSTSVTPVGARRFLGPFGPETVTLRLDDIPYHGFVIIHLDLFIIGSWDGNYVSPTGGPDIWDLSAADGQMFMHTTFNTHTFAAQYQAYPDDYPEGSYPSNTGATEVGTLGYGCSGSCTNAVYHIERILDDSNHDLVLEFSATNLEGLANESWGLDNVSVFIEGTAPDFDHDWDVDLLDYVAFWICYNGPNLPPRIWCPVDADFDDDGDVDQFDFAAYQGCYGGIDSAPNCISD